MTAIGLILHPAELIESTKKMTLGGAKDEHFLAFIAHANLGELDWNVMHLVN